MGRQCGICSRPNLAEINAALASGAAVRRLANRFGVSLTSLQRHAKNCSSRPPPVPKPPPGPPKLRGRPCMCCAHPKTSAISAALVAGQPERHIAQDFGVVLASLQRHRKYCLGLDGNRTKMLALERAQGAAAIAALPSLEALGGGYDAIRARADALALQAEKTGAPGLALQAYREMRACLDGVAGLVKISRPEPAVSVNVNVSVQAVVAELLGAIGRPTPAVLDALEVIADAE